MTAVECDRARDQQPMGCPFLEEDGATRLALLESHQKASGEKLTEVAHAVLGQNGDPGLRGDVRDLKRMREQIDRLYWTLVGALVLQVVLWFAR